jgi:hypothetical protein
MKIHLFSIPLIAASLATFLLACGGGGSSSSSIEPAATSNYQIVLTNLTNNQPLSPVALILHSDPFSAWEEGLPASDALEALAESGSPAELLQAADADSNVLATASGAGIVLPGGQASLDVGVDTGEDLRLTVATMLVNTNDAFGGLLSRSIGELGVGEAAVFYAPAYDAGTEANSESAASIPGPAAGGEGFNVSRDDSDTVHIHPGVISSQDGLAGSVLDGSHRWDNPVFKLVVTRLS